MSFERTCAAAFSGALAVSAGMALVRHEEDYARRAGLKGTSLLKDPEGRNIEFVSRGPSTDGERPVVVLENGLGAPLEGWDWVARALSREFHVIAYHRRGYARTKSLMRPAALVETLLREVAPDGPVVLVSHSIGALVSANVLAESPYVRGRTRAFYMLDGTDAVLLDEDRASRQRSARFLQLTMQEVLASATGVNRWVTSPVERDVEYRPDVQRAYVVTASSVRSLVAAQREYVTEPTIGQRLLPDLDIERHVLAAADNVEQQQTLADRTGAKFSTVQGSSHRSIIGRLDCAETVAAVIRGGAL